MKSIRTKKQRVCIGMIALGITFSSVGNLPTYAWGSQENIEQPSAHVFLVEQGLNMVMADLTEADRQNPELMAVLNQFQTDLNRLKAGAVAPDFSDKQYLLYQDHFYDPYTKKNFTNFNNSVSTTVLDYVFPTAMYRSKSYTGNALQLWNEGRTTEAVFEFGKAMHYFADMCEPHHASNAIGGTWESSTKHSAFENYADGVMTQYALSTTGGSTDSGSYSAYADQAYFSDFVNLLGDDSAKEAQRQYNEVFQAGNKGTWANTADLSLKNAQKSVAQVIYHFAKVASTPGNESNHATATPLQMNVRVKTTSGSLINAYGTDNDVYFGVELKNGRIAEWKLDKSGYNDHENGDNDTYAVQMDRAAGSEVRKAWIRKQRGWEAGTAEDNWHLAEVEVTSADGQLEFLAPVHNWLKGNVDIDIFQR